MATITAELVASEEKRDARGRNLAGSARREAILAAYERSSGLTQREFASREGVRYHTLTTWLRRRRQEERAATSPAVRFAEVAMPAAVARLEVSLPSGLIVRGQDVAQVAALIKALR
jgi:hypothetical protein